MPFACNGSTCPLAAFDPGNQDFRNWWISSARSILDKGYKGLWIDDVNMEYRIGYANSNDAIPRDPRTGAPMTYDAWKGYIADFTQQIRQAFPNKEILHNSIWYAGGPNRDYDWNVIRQIQSANFINVERGFSDTGLWGFDGPWSEGALMNYIDHVHSLGAHVVIDEYGFNNEYGVAGYFLINDGQDAFGNESVKPWYTAWVYSVNLGYATSGRYMWNGMMRRDFQNGFVVFNAVGGLSWADARSPGYHRADGTDAQWLWLPAGQGAVLLKN